MPATNTGSDGKGKSYLEILKDNISSTVIKKRKEPEVLNEAEPKVKIPIEKGDLGLSLDEPLDKYKAQVTGGKKWEELSQQLNTLVVFNKNKHPDIAKKASDKREALAKWVEGKRKDNPEFGK